MDSNDVLHILLLVLGAALGLIKGLIPVILAIKRRNSVPVDRATGKPSGTPLEDALRELPQSISGGQQ